MSAPHLAVCLVVTDDGRDLHGCLQSLRQLGPLLAQTCVYGAGAPEHVLEFARKGGATVEAGEWDGDGAGVRNRAACMTDATWVLCLESDERLRVDPDRLARLLETPADEVRPADAISVEVSGRGGPRRQARIYRPERAHFVGALDEHLEALDGRSRLVTLTPAPEVISIWSVVAEEAEQESERDRLSRRHARATAALAKLERSGVEGNDLVTALVERSRVRRSLGDDDGALADLNRARKVKASDRYRWRAREDLTTLLIEHGYFDGANRLIGELRADGADADYSDWLNAQVYAAQGQARGAWEILRRLGEVTSADGRVVAATDILTEAMVMANRLGMFDEALLCCVDLVARHGLARRHGRMLLKLWGPRSPEGLTDLLIQADGRHLDEVAAALDELPEPGPEVARGLREVRSQRPAAVRIM